MAGIKRDWIARLKSVGKTYHHTYQGNTCVDGRYVVFLRMSLDREEGRTIFVRLSPSEAREMADKLNAHADSVDIENGSI